MELHRLAIAIMALLLAVSIAFAAGRIALSGSATRLQMPATATRTGEVPVLRIGEGAPTRDQSAPLLEQPTPAATMTPRTRQDEGTKESNDPKIVSGRGE